MKPADPRVFSLIIKIWIEGRDPVGWHGQVTHVPSGEESYVSRIEDITTIISRYLAESGFRPGLSIRLKQWVRALRAKK